ncbi:MAG: DUF4132 domain-containing protein [Planctomycetes bacterium]|nr:DUF4132 domain-containing protein [Planctomycetota bacterium]MCB9919414.1 DUF4132 domain-containing protein [Planctomycetota bacterium]
MSTSDIREQLRAQRKPDLVKKRLGRHVPKALREVLGMCLDEESPYAQSKLIEEAKKGLAKSFVAMSDASRHKLFTSLLPQYADELGRAFEILRLRPFQSDSFRKPFRCPGAQQQLAEQRAAFFARIVALLGPHEGDAVWLAAHAPFLPYGCQTDLAWLLAAALDIGDARSDRVFETLKDCANGEHPVGQMGRHVTTALMASSREDAWAYNEKLLLAAQRQEGLRQVILEAIDEAHPQAFRRMLRLIREERLSRFSSVVRACDTWFGFLWDGASAVKIDSILERVESFLDDPAARRAALDRDHGEDAYLALWAIAFDDVEAAVREADALLGDASPDKRFAATNLLVQSSWSRAYPPLTRALGDPDLRIAAHALSAFRYHDVSEWVDCRELFDACEELLGRTTAREQKLESILWPWTQTKLVRAEIANAMARNRKGVDPRRMIAHAGDLEPYMRQKLLRDLAKMPSRWERTSGFVPAPLEGDHYSLAIEFLGDKSADVRGCAFDALVGTPLRETEVDRLVALLSRKAGDLRNRAIVRLGGLPNDALLTLVDKLLGDKDKMRRIAGLELLRACVEAARLVDASRTRAAAYRDDHAELDATESNNLESILDGEAEVASKDDALGFVNSAARFAWPAPTKTECTIITTAALACVESLAKRILELGETELERPSGEKQLLLDSYGFSPEDRKRYLARPDSGGEKACPQHPLIDEWRAWMDARPAKLRDKDGRELLRAWAMPNSAWKGEVSKSFVNGRRWSTLHFLDKTLSWCVFWTADSNAYDFLLDCFEGDLAALTAKDYETLRAQTGGYYRTYGQKAQPWEQRIETAQNTLRHLSRLEAMLPDAARDEQAFRLYGLVRYAEVESGGNARMSIDLERYLRNYRAGSFGDRALPEFFELCVGQARRGGVLRAASSRRGTELEGFPDLQDAIARCRDRIVDVEAKRGDRPTAATMAALELRCSGSFRTLSAAMDGLGKMPFARMSSYSDERYAKKASLSHLVLRSFPSTDDASADGHARFAQWARERKISEKRLAELASYAPQWTGHVASVLTWPGFEAAIWWLHAHTKDEHWESRDLREEWQAQISERTPLSAEELTEGAVDVAWFRAAYEALGAERWELVSEAAKFASSSGGHKRAQLFADAMAGAVAGEELVARIDGKRHQDSVRALGLLPLPTGEERDGELLARYQRLERFRRESRKFGSQRQASEGRAVDIGLENLARTAGFADPVRLQWAMEREAVRDLAEGPVVLSLDDVRLTLVLDDAGRPQLTIQREDKKKPAAFKTLKAVPADLRKNEDLVQLRARVQELRRQSSRVRASLELAMCRGDVFSAAELREMARHPVLAPTLARLLVIGVGERSADLFGLVAHGGQALEDTKGGLEPLAASDRVRLAHPHDLFARGVWSDWQRACFERELVQPFRQVFRELYPLTDSERDTGTFSRRFAGHQVQPRQAFALLGGRGWVAQPEEGVSKTFHDAGITARLGFEETFYSPAEIEDLTLDQVVFRKKGEYEALRLVDIESRIFSETMRDLDLVVSVAHSGGVDPEASASTLEMRARLVRETCTLLGIDNVEVKEQNAIIRGAHATYSLHLGSAVVRVLGGAMLAIVAVHSGHRGRIFLPFEDDDPRSAEVLSKVLLLARDKQIRDAKILDQIRYATGQLR